MLMCNANLPLCALPQANGSTKTICAQVAKAEPTFCDDLGCKWIHLLNVCMVPSLHLLDTCPPCTQVCLNMCRWDVVFLIILRNLSTDYLTQKVKETSCCTMSTFRCFNLNTNCYMHPRLITHRFFDTSHWLRPGKSLAASVLASFLVWCPLRQALPWEFSSLRPVRVELPQFSNKTTNLDKSYKKLVSSKTVVENQGI